jgi:tyrosine-protein kinase Etk/Wzc
MREGTLPTYEAIRAEQAPQKGEAGDAREHEVDLLQLGTVVLSHKVVILKFALVSALLTVVVLLFMKPTYTAVASFLPPNSMSSTSSTLIGQLGSLSNAGGALGGLKDPTQIYVGLLSSRTIADDLIRQFNLAKVYGTQRPSQTEKALASHTEITSGKDTIITVSVKDHDPKRAADLANAYLDELHQQNDRIALTEAGQKRLFFQRQLEQEKNALAEAEVNLTRSQEQTGLILPGGQTRLQIETIAQTQADIASREIQLAAVSQAATAQNPDVVRIRSEIGALKAQLSKLENSGSPARAGNVQIATSKVPEVTLSYVRQAREVKYHEALYELLLRQYESAKLDESRSAPLMQVVDYAVVPDSKSGPPRTLFSAIALVLGGFVGLAWVLAKHALNIMSQDSGNRIRLDALRAAAAFKQ